MDEIYVLLAALHEEPPDTLLLTRDLATNLPELGAAPQIAQAILRHANVRITLDFYTKVRPEQKAAAMSSLEAAFKKDQKAFEKKLKASW